MEKVKLYTTASIDDPEIESIRFEITLKEGITAEGKDSFLIERGLLKHVGANLLSWFQYCRDHGIKTL